MRQKNAAHVPLIGISTLSVLKGSEAFTPSEKNIKTTSREVLIRVPSSHYMFMFIYIYVYIYIYILYIYIYNVYSYK